MEKKWETTVEHELNRYKSERQNKSEKRIGIKSERKGLKEK
jgi:hypothetical protein